MGLGERSFAEPDAHAETSSKTQTNHLTTLSRQLWR